MTTHLFSETQQNEIIRLSAENMGFISDDIEKCKTFITNSTSFLRIKNWAPIGTVSVNLGYLGNCFDGRYFYVAPLAADSYCPFYQYDTLTPWVVAGGTWNTITVSTAFGTSTAATLQPSTGCVFDGRYVYYTPATVFTYIRFDTSKSFSDATAWEKMNASTAQGGSTEPGTSLTGGGPIFDGRYIYYIPRSLNSFLRFDTTLSFTNAAAWEKISMSTVHGVEGIDEAYYDGGFDGRYVYYCPFVSKTFLRFDTTLAFTNSSAWEKMSISTAQGAASPPDYNFGSMILFDGRYMYYTPRAGNTFIRFDTSKSFTNSSAWEKMSASTAQGAAEVTWGYYGAAFDGRYIHYTPDCADSFIKFDTSKSFTDSSAWEKVSLSTAHGAALLDNAYAMPCFDGKYVYHWPYNSDIVVRVLAMNSNIGRR